jgi:hypothetical protein
MFIKFGANVVSLEATPILYVSVSWSLYSKMADARTSEVRATLVQFFLGPEVMYGNNLRKEWGFCQVRFC